MDGRPVRLSPVELDLLVYLVRHPGQAHSRGRLLEHVWGKPVDGEVDTRTVDVHVARLRRKVGPEHGRAIETVHGVGYRFQPRRAVA